MELLSSADTVTVTGERKREGRILSLAGKREQRAAAPHVASAQIVASVEAITAAALEFNDDVSDIILIGAEAEFDAFRGYVIWRMRQANELLVRTLKWFGETGKALPDSFGEAVEMRAAETAMEQAAINHKAETFALADEYLARMRAYLTKARQ